MALEIRDIHKQFGSVRASDGVTFVVEDGSLHGILGENGAGKSTLMKILSGFYEADSGVVDLDGEVLDLRSPADAIQAGIGMLHQDPLVFLPFTVLDNFVLGSPGPVRLDRSSARAPGSSALAASWVSDWTLSASPGTLRWGNASSSRSRASCGSVPRC